MTKKLLNYLRFSNHLKFISENLDEYTINITLLFYSHRIFNRLTLRLSQKKAGPEKPFLSFKKDVLIVRACVQQVRTRITRLRTELHSVHVVLFLSYGLAGRPNVNAV